MEVLERIVDGNPPLSHIPGTSEVGDKLRIPEDKLVTYLQEKLSLYQEGGAPVIRRFKHGQSNPTYYVAYGGEELVLRKKPVSLCLEVLAVFCLFYVYVTLYVFSL